MKKLLIFLTVFFFITAAGFSQNNVNDIKEMDQAVRSLAIGIHAKLLEKKADKVFVGQFTFQNSVPLLGDYLSNQLAAELANMPRRNYTVLSGAATESVHYVVTGGIIHTLDILRLYTRIIKLPDMSIEASFSSDFQRSDYILSMISSSSRSSFTRSDPFEPDSRESPVNYEIGSSENVSVMERSLTESDSDFFLLIPKGSGRLTIETTGNLDTIMELYNESGERIALNDDGGANNNARITIRVNEGKRYIALVKGYESSETGSYGFRAYLVILEDITRDEFEPDDTFIQAKAIVTGSTQKRSFHSSDDIDWVRFEVSREGRYVINARGTENNRLDTYFELFDADQNKIAEDDDGGESYSARLSINLKSGVYYLKIMCLDDNPDQWYTLNIAIEP